MLSSCSLDEIALIIVSKRELFVDSALGWLESNSVTIPQSRIYQYTPPKEAGVAHVDREEKIPKIQNPGLVYLIIDDVFDRGSTLRCAIKALENQGVARDRMWFLVGNIYNSHEPHLDKAQVFLDYLPSLGSFY